MTEKPDDVQRLLAEAPFVRALARSLVADEADDVAQQAYLQALSSPAVPSRPHAWLLRVVQNVAVDLRRRRARRQLREREAAVHERLPSSRELLEVEERRRALVAAVDALPVDQRAVVLMRYYEGLPPRRIAVELGVPVATVWSRLHEALQALRARLDREHGDRRSWLVSLAALARAPRALPWREVLLGGGGSAFWIGVMAMTAKTKVLAAMATVMVAAGAWMLWPGGSAPASPSASPGAGELPALAQGDVGGAAPTAGALPPRRQAVGVPQLEPTTGNLVVHVLYADEPKAAAGLDLILNERGGDFRIGTLRAITDARGTARFDAVPPGEWVVNVQRAGGHRRTAVRAGEVTDFTVQLSAGMTVAGVVVDGTGTPIAGATVEGGHPGISQADAAVLAVTAADGSFAVRDGYVQCLYGARAAGFAASTLQFVDGRSGGRADIRIELTKAGGCVDGQVVHLDGSPIAGALVQIGQGATEGIRSSMQGADPLPALVPSDADGRFLAVGLPVGSQPVQVRAAGLGPWKGECEVAANLTVALRVVLTDGVTCAGVVHSEAGEPLAGVDVRSGDVGDFLQYFARSGADGSFTLRGLPAADVVLTAREEDLGKATATVRGEPGATVPCELVLVSGQVLRGRLVDQTGAPVGSDRVMFLQFQAKGSGARWFKNVAVKDDGHFVVPDCPPGRLLSVRVDGKGLETLQRDDIDPRAGECVMKLQRDLGPPAHVVGRIHSPEGRPVQGLDVRVSRRGSSNDSRWAETDAEGRFAFEISTGAWHLWTSGRQFPKLTLGYTEVAAGATWDVGTLQLPAGGRLIVRGEGAEKLDYRILDPDERFLTGVQTKVPPLRSDDPLAAGRYLLLVRGKGKAAQVLPFAIEGDKDTTVELHAAAGVRQRIEFAAAPGAESPDGISFDVRHEGKLLLSGYARGVDGGAPADEVWLLPGSYEVTTRQDGPQGRASFAVGDREAGPVRVPLR